MRTVLLVGIGVLMMIPLYSQNADDIKGIWLNEDQDARIEISKGGNGYSGKIIWIKPPAKGEKAIEIDIHNSNPDLRARPLIGLIVLRHFTFSNAQWREGELYDPKSGFIYRGKITLEADQLIIRGFMGAAVFGKSVTWTRVPD